MTTSSAPTHQGFTAMHRRPLIAAALLLVGALVGAALMSLLHFMPIANGNSLDPASAECTSAFDAFREGERTSSLLQIVNDCTAEAR